jgi:hypothetical protein
MSGSVAISVWPSRGQNCDASGYSVPHWEHRFIAGRNGITAGIRPRIARILSHQLEKIRVIRG